MATTGDVLGGTAASTTGSPNGNWHWANPSNALVDSATVASVTLGGTGDGTYWLHITNFGFAIPPDATINGITVKFRRKSNTANDVVTDSIRLVNSGTLLGAAKPPTYAFWPTTAAVETFGGASDLWNWTNPPVATINSSTFGVQIAAIDDSSGSGDIPAIEVVWINITYTAAGGGGGPTNSHRSTLMWF